ncbi:hypothetical protein K438DRAFT_1812732 [Mycena galopus ATCC 62051]|nr:hypothetical protein K438DRAFT_1812732 [Mycena galopus ATCC 62051]
MANHSLFAHFDFFLLPPWPQQRLETFFRWVFSGVFTFMFLMGPSMVSTVCGAGRLVVRLETFFRWVFSGVFTFMFLMGPSMVSTVCVGPATMWFAVRCSGLLNSNTFMAGDPWFLGRFYQDSPTPAVVHLSYCAS